MAELVFFDNRKELDRLESTISRNMKAFYEVGCALAEIRDKGYYKDVLGFSTFEEYCRVKWDMSKMHAYRLMDSVKVVDAVKSNQLVTPTTESQVRPLARLEPEQQRNVWEKVVEIAPEGKITASLVSKITKRMFPTETKKISTETHNENDSQRLFSLKRLWKAAFKKEKQEFIQWAKDQGEI